MILRTKNTVALTRALEQVFATRTLDAWRPVLDAAGLIWSPVQRLDEALADPQARALGCFQRVVHPTAGAYETTGAPFRIDGEPVRASTPPSALGADAAALLREVGIAEAEIERLTRDPRSKRGA